MRILIARATGSVGSAVLRRTREDCYDTVRLVHDLSGARASLGREVDFAKGDIASPWTYTPLVRDCDVVVHAAMLAVSGRLTPRRAAGLPEADRLAALALADERARQASRPIDSGGYRDWGDHDKGWVDE